MNAYDYIILITVIFFLDYDFCQLYTKKISKLVEAVDKDRNNNEITPDSRSNNCENEWKSSLCILFLEERFYYLFKDQWIK